MINLHIGQLNKLNNLFRVAHSEWLRGDSKLGLSHSNTALIESLLEYGGGCFFLKMAILSVASGMLKMFLKEFTLEACRRRNNEEQQWYA